jgi:type II secretory pathway pseudopilin PulG
MRAMASSARRQRGFTLVEVMIAILLTAIAIIGIVALYMSETRASGYSRHTTEASVLAEDKLEQLFRLAAICAPVPCTGAAADAGKIDAEGNTGTGGIFTRSWTATAPINTTYWDLVITVSWVEDDPGNPKSVVLRGRRNQ